MNIFYIIYYINISNVDKMSKSKLTLVIDGNWLLMSRLSVIQNRFATEKELVANLKVMMCKSINVMLRNIPIIDNVILVGDGGSWRNDIEVPEFLKNKDIEYKGNREKDPNINWDLIFQGYEEFFDTISLENFIVSKHKGIEGDDWCWFWSKYLNERGTNVIIWSKDKDLTQLVNTNPNTGCFTVCWNKDYMTKLYQEKDINDMSFFFNTAYSTNEKILGTIENKAKSINEISPKDIVIDKIVRGDLGDNVLPIMTKKSINSSRVYRISTNDLPLELDISNKSDIWKWVHSIYSNKKYAGKLQEDEQEVIEHFEYNKKLVYLDKSSIPEDIKGIMNDLVKSYNMNECHIDFSKIEGIFLAEKNSDTYLLDEI